MLLKIENAMMYFSITQPGIIFYVVLFILVLLLMKMHNGILASSPEILHFRTIAPRDKAIIYLVLMGGTLLLMLSCTRFSAPSPQRWWIMMLAIIVVMVTSFLLIITLHGALSNMKKNRQLSCNSLFEQDFLLTTYFIVFTQLSFLNWLKEVIVYFQYSFLSFIIGYLIIILITSVLISKFSQRDESSELSYLPIAIIDALITSVSSIILFFVVLTVMLYIS